jgi:hypothetical protein
MIIYSKRFNRMWLRFQTHIYIPVWIIEAWYDQFRKEGEIRFIME